MIRTVAEFGYPLPDIHTHARWRLKSCLLLSRHPFRNPGVSFAQPFRQGLCGRPSQFLLYEAIIRISTAHTQRSGNMLQPDVFARNLRDHLR